MIAALVALSLLATTTRLSAQDWKGGGRIGGKVVDDGGKPVANALVKLRLAQAGNVGPDVRTDKSGEFSALSLRGGTWNIDVEAPGYSVKKMSVMLPAGEGRVPPVVWTMPGHGRNAHATVDDRPPGDTPPRNPGAGGLIAGVFDVVWVGR